jgi:DNA-binding MarR family transcriptional regulator
MTRVVSRLAGDGLVERQVRPGDRRQVLVTIGAQGRALLAADRRRRDEWLSARLAELPDSDIAALNSVIPILERLASS